MSNRCQIDPWRRWRLDGSTSRDEEMFVIVLALAGALPMNGINQKTQSTRTAKCEPRTLSHQRSRMRAWVYTKISTEMPTKVKAFYVKCATGSPRRLSQNCSRQIWQCSRRCTRKCARSVFICSIFTCSVSRPLKAYRWQWLRSKSCESAHLLEPPKPRKIQSSSKVTKNWLSGPPSK